MYSVFFKKNLIGTSEPQSEKQDCSSLEEACEKYHYYLYYGYNQKSTFDYFMCTILDADGLSVKNETWRAPVVEGESA